MAWPTPQDYNEAVQNPHLNFRDAELRGGTLEVTPMGLPRVASGAFASVYRMQTERRDVAVRCFLHNVADQQKRYAAISEFVSHDNLDCTVAFDYLSEGIRVGAVWYPLLKMEWASGKPLDEWVRNHLRDSDKVRELCERFKDMLAQMRRDGIAHGDLQHGNLLIQDDLSLRLVDYDGMYVPALQGLECPEIGHRNYQHPGRTKEDYGPYLDNFSAWSIFISLFCLSRDPNLMQAVVGGDESLLFRQFDYKNPTRSRTFAVLESHADPEVVSAARKMRALLALAPQAVPYLDDGFEAPDNLPELDIQRKLRQRAAVAAAQSNLPAWMREDPTFADDPDEGRGVEDEVDFRESIGLASRRPTVATADASWPTVSQYVKAISVPAASFLEQELQMSRPVRVDGRVMVQRSQQNAVFRLQRGARSLAVKVFLAPDEYRATRYRDFRHFMESEKVLESALPKYIPRIEFIENGIRVEDRVFPIVKMEWIQGQTLEQLEADAAKTGVFDSARHQFCKLVEAMDAWGFVHGELEPSNIIVSPEGLKLIDFDAVLIPGGMAPPAVSRSSLRHPHEGTQVNADSDRFPAWVIDTALVVLREQPDLRFSKPSGQFIFEQDDFLFPDQSDILQSMRDSKNSIVRQRCELLQALAKLEPTWRLPRLIGDVGLDKSFAKDNGLNFPEIDQLRVSPDLDPSAPPQYPTYSPSSSLLPRTSGNNEVELSKEVVFGIGGFVLLFGTMALFKFAGVVAAIPFFFFLMVWITFFNPKSD